MKGEILVGGDEGISSHEKCSHKIRKKIILIAQLYWCRIVFL